MQLMREYDLEFYLVEHDPCSPFLVQNCVQLVKTVQNVNISLASVSVITF